MLKRRKKLSRVRKKKVPKKYPIGDMLEGVKKRRVVKSRRKRYPKKGRLVMCLGTLPKEGVPEIKIRFNKSPKRFLGTATSSKDASDFIRKIYTRGSIELQEHFIVLYLSTRNEIIGYYKHAVGGISATQVDVRLILGTALKSTATGIILAHNHPSGNLRESDADKRITQKMKEASDLVDVRLLDHIIVTKKGFFSFADEGLI